MSPSPSAPVMPSMLRPQIIVLREGTDTSQGRAQLISNINACVAVSDILRTTLGPRGMDKLIVDSRGKTTISNDGATIIKQLEIIQPAARALVDIARAQDNEAGDGTTSVVLLAAEFLHSIKGLIQEGVAPQTIIKGFRIGLALAIARLQEMSFDLISDGDERSLLERVARTAMNSKLIQAQGEFFSRIVVDALLHLNPLDLNLKMIGIKRIPGGALEDSQLILGVSFKKTFTYAGYEQQPKLINNPKILCLNLELELKAERDNAEIRIDRVKEYKQIVDAEWQIIFDKLDQIVKSGANVVFSRMAIGDVATQYFADRGIFCAGRVPLEDLERVIKATGGSIQASTQNLSPTHLGSCEIFEERQVGGERFNFLSGCPGTKCCTLLLRGGADQFIAEVERSLHDAMMVVRRTMTSKKMVAGGGAVEMELAKCTRQYSRSVQGRLQLVLSSYAQAFEALPRQLCENAGLDSVDILTRLRKSHGEGHYWSGVDVMTFEDFDPVKSDMRMAAVLEPLIVKESMINSATEAACMILSIDLTIGNPKKQDLPPN